jgi:hypothetical protein
MLTLVRCLIGSTARWLDGQLKPPVLESGAARFAELEAEQEVLEPPELSVGFKDGYPYQIPTGAQMGLGVTEADVRRIVREEIRAWPSAIVRGGSK